MCHFKIIIQKSDVADNAEAVSKDGKLIGIAEVSVDVELFCVRGGRSLWGDKAVSHLVRVNTGIIFVESFETPDKGIEGFWVVFGDIKFNGGSIERADVCKERINA